MSRDNELGIIHIENIWEVSWIEIINATSSSIFDIIY